MMESGGKREGGQLLRRAEAACGGEAGPEAAERIEKPLAPPEDSPSDYPVRVASLRRLVSVRPSWQPRS